MQGQYLICGASGSAELAGLVEGRGEAREGEGDGEAGEVYSEDLHEERYTLIIKFQTGLYLEYCHFD